MADTDTFHPPTGALPSAALVARSAPRPHDLLWLRGPGSFVFPPTSAPVPAWAADQAVRCERPVVVRRAAPLGHGWVPVGLRGAAREERCAAHAYADDVLRTVTPEDIARGQGWRLRSQPEPSAAMRLLGRVAPLLDASPFAWGVVGAVGYALAGGADVLRPESDLDLLLRAPSAAGGPALRELAAALGAAGDEDADGGTRIDVQVETPIGAFSLAEWARGDAFVMLRTPEGPRLVTDPWCGTDDAAPAPPRGAATPAVAADAAAEPAAAPHAAGTPHAADAALPHAGADAPAVPQAGSIAAAPTATREDGAAR